MTLTTTGENGQAIHNPVAVEEQYTTLRFFGGKCNTYAKPQFIVAEQKSRNSGFMIETQILNKWIKNNCNVGKELRRACQRVRTTSVLLRREIKPGTNQLWAQRQTGDVTPDIGTPSTEDTHLILWSLLGDWVSG